MSLLKQPHVLAWLVASFFLLVLAAILTFTCPTSYAVALGSTILTLFAGSVFFPILVGYFYDRLKEAESGEAIWKVFRELSEAGIMRIYRDREESPYPDNGVTELRNAFLTHRTGEIKLIGVSLRVFFSPPGPFYGPICQLGGASGEHPTVAIKALVLDPDSPEAKNRAAIETPGMCEPLIYKDIALTVANIEHARSQCREGFIEVGYYDQAPYCTAVLFPGRCFFSPNLISKLAPVKLPLIVFRSDAHAYRALNDYFDTLWATRKQPMITRGPAQ